MNTAFNKRDIGVRAETKLVLDMQHSSIHRTCQHKANQELSYLSLLPLVAANSKKQRQLLCTYTKLMSATLLRKVYTRQQEAQPTAPRTRQQTEATKNQSMRQKPC